MPRYTDNQKISARILAAMAAGKTVQEAMDEVLGAGMYEKMVDGLYDELRARAR